MRVRPLLATTAATATALGLLVAPAAAGPPTTTYEVTVTNLTFGQPLSPIAAATHRPGIDLFEVGRPANDAIVAIAENGDPSVAADLLTGSRLVTDAHVAPAPIVPTGVRPDAPFQDTSQTFTIEARPGDRLSLATMLICTNDGFTGLDAVRLPREGSATHRTAAYDAGSEVNTEASTDIVDPCSGIGPVVLDGDPDGNANDGLDEDGVVTMHPNVRGDADLLPAHGWDGPVTSVTVTAVG